LTAQANHGNDSSKLEKVARIERCQIDPPAVAFRKAEVDSSRNDNLLGNSTLDRLGVRIENWAIVAVGGESFSKKAKNLAANRAGEPSI